MENTRVYCRFVSVVNRPRIIITNLSTYCQYFTVLVLYSNKIGYLINLYSRFKEIPISIMNPNSNIDKF